MAPTLALHANVGVMTRSKRSLSGGGITGGGALRVSNVPSNSKRKQESSPPKPGKTTLKRRPALGELTNAAPLKSSILKKGSNIDLNNLKSSKVPTFNIHQDVIKAKPKSKLTNTKILGGGGNNNGTKSLSVLSNTKNILPTKTVNRVNRLCNTNAATINNIKVNNKLPSKQVTKPFTYLTHKKPLIETQITINNKLKHNIKLENRSKEHDDIIPIILNNPEINIRRESLRSHRRSSGIKSDESSLYVSALDDLDITNSNGSKGKKSDILNKKQSTKVKRSEEKKEKSLIEHFEKEIEIKGTTTPAAEKKQDKIQVAISKAVPEGVDDFDHETWFDHLQVSSYAMYIFQYLKTKEADFKIKDYINFQSKIGGKGSINIEMRSVLIDWMVEIQETFELNHETLYLAVKLVDLYLSRSICSRETLQLLGAVAIFVSSKFDDRIPPQLSDLEYICSNAYSIQDLKDMEIKLITTIDFNLGIPLSYRFLRRYARCNKIQLPLLTLARYILELSLLEYELIFESDSKLACASLYLAQKMDGNLQPWNKTLEYFSGYKIEDFKEIVIKLNRILHGQPRTVMMQSLATIFNKYSHTIFFEVAKTPLLKEKDLFLLKD